MDSLADAIMEVIREEGQGGVRKKTLFLLSAYKLGKERILLHVARRTGLKVRSSRSRAEDFPPETGRTVSMSLSRHLLSVV